MKTSERSRRDGIQSPVFEDSGVAISGEPGEHSFSGECEGIVCLQGQEGPRGNNEDECQDPRSDCMSSYNVVHN